MINEGQTAYIKTTGEEVFVLAVQENKRALPEGSSLSGQIAVVRRPVAGENGCFHNIDSFCIEELETKESRMERHLSNQREFENRLKQAVDESGLVGQDAPAEDLPN